MSNTQKQTEQQNNSDTLNLANLTQKYSNLIISYKAAVADYANELKNNINSDSKNTHSNESNNVSFVSIKGQAFVGTGSAGESNATTLQDCIASCSSTKGCSGATFVSDKCMIRTGDSPVISSNENSYAIIPKNKQLVLNMESLNKELLSVNKELVEKLQEQSNNAKDGREEIEIKRVQLLKNNEKLLEERRNIAEIIRDYDTIQSNKNDTELSVTQNYYSFILLALLVFIILIVLYKIGSSGSASSVPASLPPVIQMGGKLKSNAYYITFVIILLSFIVTYYNYQ
jgi:hypothetical protein